MPSMRADAVRNRDHLLAAASRLFTERGVDVPLEEVARSAGVSIGTLYNHFPNRGALIDAVLPERLAEIDRLGESALSDEDVWRGFTGFVDGVVAIQARDRAINDAIARGPVGALDIGAECGRGGGVLDAVVQRAHDARVLRPDFGTDDFVVVMAAMAQVIVMSDGDDTRWRRYLRFVLDGLRCAD